MRAAVIRTTQIFTPTTALGLGEDSSDAYIPYSQSHIFAPSATPLLDDSHIETQC